MYVPATTYCADSRTRSSDNFSGTIETENRTEMYCFRIFPFVWRVAKKLRWIERIFCG